MTRLSLLALALTLAACSGPPPANSALDAARDLYASAAAQPAVTAASADYLDEAEAQLATAEALRLEKEEPTLIDHHAYLATQLVRTAVLQSERVAAEAEIATAEAERRSVQLEVRTAEADAARRRAEVAQREAATERAAAEAERRRAEEAQRQAAEQRTAAEDANRRAAEERAAAEAAQRDAERARQEAAAALARAQELASRISELEAAQTERGLVLTLGDVLFDVGKADLKPGSYRAVEQLVQFLNEYPQRRVLIEGFTDSSGSDDTNLTLSQRRSDAVQRALVERGVAANRVATRGYGEAFPRATNDNAAGRQLNRRVEVIISGDDGRIPERTQ